MKWARIGGESAVFEGCRTSDALAWAYGIPKQIVEIQPTEGLGHAELQGMSGGPLVRGVCHRANDVHARVSLGPAQ